jgi:hypothetical protein
MDCIRKLSGMGNNLNQIARKANAEGYTNARSEYFYLADKIDNVINTIEDDSKNSYARERIQGSNQLRP